MVSNAGCDIVMWRAILLRGKERPDIFLWEGGGGGGRAHQIASDVSSMLRFKMPAEVSDNMRKDSPDADAFGRGVAHARTGR